jgi:putative FmdB family regulatory protein
VPLYDYRCLDCGAWDRRLGGIDDLAALCPRCRGVTLRQTEEVFRGCCTGEPDRAGAHLFIPVISVPEGHIRG